MEINVLIELEEVDVASFSVKEHNQCLSLATHPRCTPAAMDKYSIGQEEGCKGEEGWMDKLPTWCWMGGQTV